MPKNENEQVRTITHTLMFIDNHRDLIVETLFAGSTDGYKKEWYDRSITGFWQHLDLGNAAQVVKLAEAYYA